MTYDGRTVSCPCRARHPFFAYVSLGDRVNVTRVRLRLCQEHAAELADDLFEHSVNAEDCSAAFRARPESCDFDKACELYPGNEVLFVTYYYPDGARTDRAARLCEQHLVEARQNFVWGL